jgi:hypothetical protein
MHRVSAITGEIAISRLSCDCPTLLLGNLDGESAEGYLADEILWTRQMKDEKPIQFSVYVKVAFWLALTLIVISGAVLTARMLIRINYNAAHAGRMEGYESPSPIAFNHKLHADHKIECSSCHETTSSASKGAVPVALCTACHKAYKESGSIPDSLLHPRALTPSTNGLFDHGFHAAKINCKTCHDADTIGKSISAGGCAGCHKDAGKGDWKTKDLK